MSRDNEPGIDWGATFRATGSGGTVKVVYCRAFKRGGGSWGDVCSRCGVREPEHFVEPDDATADGNRS